MYTRIDSESIYIWQVACSSWLFISSFFHVAFILRSILLVMRKRSCDSIHFLFVALFFFFSFPDDALLISNRCANVETRTYSCCSVAFSHLYFSSRPLLFLQRKLKIWNFFFFFFFYCVLEFDRIVCAAVLQHHLLICSTWVIRPPLSPLTSLLTCRRRRRQNANIRGTSRKRKSPRAKFVAADAVRDTLLCSNSCSSSASIH